MVSESGSLFSISDFFLVLKVVYYASWVLVPLALIIIVIEMWVDYRRAQFMAKQNFLLLEVRVPRDVFKSPKAAEFFINSLFQTVGEKNWFERIWQGKVRAWFSLEIVSVGGSVHFFVWTRKGFKSIIEANLYSQYPGIEVTEVKDYTLPVYYDPERITLWASEFELTKRDAFPIKTYIDYGMDKDPKEEYKIDPMTPLLEFLGGMPREHQVWIQIIVRAHKAEEKDPSKKWKDAKIFLTLKPSDIWDRWEKKDMRWKEAAKDEIQKIVDGAKGEKGPDGKYIPGTGRQLTEIEKDTISALGRSVSKSGFDVGIRALYFAPTELFNVANLGGIIGGITHFNSHLNGFRPVRGSEERYKNVFLAWKKRSDKTRNKEKQKLLDAYKRRSYYYKPFKSPHFILNSEELATIYHFPGGVAPTPTLSRIDSRKGEAPPNIPV
ncbi:MAG: hypothetical protein WAX44_03390 [Minisyncoccia bacterium]